jgi:hypothetical protein
MTGETHVTSQRNRPMWKVLPAKVGVRPARPEATTIWRVGRGGVTRSRSSARTPAKVVCPDRGWSSAMNGIFGTAVTHERHFRDMGGAPNGTFGALSDPNVPFATGPVSRTARSGRWPPRGAPSRQQSMPRTAHSGHSPPRGAFAAPASPQEGPDPAARGAFGTLNVARGTFATCPPAARGTLATSPPARGALSRHPRRHRGTLATCPPV